MCGFAVKWSPCVSRSILGVPHVGDRVCLLLGLQLVCRSCFLGEDKGGESPSPNTSGKQDCSTLEEVGSPGSWPGKRDPGDTTRGSKVVHSSSLPSMLEYGLSITDSCFVKEQC